MWLTVVLALFRYVVVCRPHNLHPQFASLKRIRQAVALVVVMSIVLCLPNYVLYGPVSLNDRPGFWIDYNEHVSSAQRVSHWQCYTRLQIKPSVSKIRTFVGTCVSPAYRCIDKFSPYVVKVASWRCR